MPFSPDKSLSIHTSDRLLFKRCRRKWNWASRLRRNLVSKESRPIGHLFFGTGWHFAMEDYHGYKKYPTMYDAFRAYCMAHSESERPYEWEFFLDLAEGMSGYYTKYWLPRHNEYRTLWLKDEIPCRAGEGEPQLEIDFSLELPGREDKVPFAGTFDGMMVDSYGRWWIKEIKTAKKIDTLKLDTDPQITGYCLAAEQHYRHEIEGVVYMQFLKEVPKEPRLLANDTFSTDVKQHTTYDTYRAAIMKKFGHVPDEYRDILLAFQDKERFEGNQFIRQDTVPRNQSAIRNELWKLQAEAEDMLNPDLVLYPNPTYTCDMECEFKAACVAFDDGSDWESILEESFEPRQETFNWRKRV